MKKESKKKLEKRADYICDKFDFPVLVKEDWTPTEYYSNCNKCKNYSIGKDE